MSEISRLKCPGLTCVMAVLFSFAALTASADVPEALVRCQVITEANSRLDCFDRAMEALTSTSTASTATLPETVVATPTPADAGQSATMQPTPTPTPTPSTATAAASVQAAAPSPTEMFGREESASRDLVKEVIGSTKLDFIEAEVTQVQHTAYGELIVELDNGQLWRQIDSRSLRLKAGERVRISAASIGSFLLEKTSGSTSIRVRRQR